ncbi:MAG: hypothetical protein P4L10_02170 [Acidobacteriaceae bacterium]|nr:hypothetical protein [Acidobacteriaceae bacterium]
MALTCSPSRKAQKTLVLVDNMVFRETHSLFFDILRGIFSLAFVAHNHELDFQLFSESAEIYKYGNYMYDNLVFFVPTTAKSATKQSQLNVKEILNFFDAPNKNVMVVTDSGVYPFTRKLANEFGVDFDPQGSRVTDGSSYEVTTKEVLKESKHIFSGAEEVTYAGIGLQLDPKNRFVFPLLKAPSHTFSLSERGAVVSENPTLVAGYQVISRYPLLLGAEQQPCHIRRLGHHVLQRPVRQDRP